MNGQMCPQCHASLVHGQWMCSQCGTEVPGADVERTMVRPPVTGSSPLAPPTTASLITSIPSSGAPLPSASPLPSTPTWSTIASTQAPVDQAVQPTFLASGQGVPVVAAPVPDASQKWLPRVAIALALVGVGLFVWKLTSGGDETAGPVTNDPTVTVVGESTVLGQTTVVETTTPPTVPVIEPPPVIPARPPWPAPAIPDPPVFSGGGLAYAISDPLVGGMPSDQPTPYLVFAQQVFDLMAVDQWAEAQKYFYVQAPGGDAARYTFDLQDPWPAADRLSLLLVNAALDTTGLSGYDLTVAVVANFPGSTSVLCGHLYSDPTSPYFEVIQRGEFVLLADGAAPFMPETLLNDPAQIADLQARCV